MLRICIARSLVKITKSNGCLEITLRPNQILQLRLVSNCPGDKIQKLATELRAKTPIDKLDELEERQHPHQEKESLKSFPGGVNPATGEQDGPRGPEPTRYGDWERKGRVTDF